MRKQEFLNHLKHLSGEPNFEMAEVLMRFPYFYAAHLLQVVQLKKNNSIKFEESIRTTSLQSPNRELLKNIVEGFIFSVNENEKPKEPEIISNKEPSTVSIEVHAEQPVLEQIDAYPERIHADQTTVNKQENKIDVPVLMMPFSAWLKQFGETNRPREATYSIEENGREALIRKFIETEPQIGKPQKASFYSAVEMARKSIEERDDIISETLAAVYAQQGDVTRAKRIYQKLCLVYPEKRSYFAALIKKLTTT